MMVGSGFVSGAAAESPSTIRSTSLNSALRVGGPLKVESAQTGRTGVVRDIQQQGPLECIIIRRFSENTVAARCSFNLN